MKPLNVLWITCDEMKARAMSVYGHSRTTMPAAERMADEGVAFSRAYVQMPKCVPSRCSMMTGRYPHCDGFRTLKGRRGTPPCPDVNDNSMVCLQADTPNLVTLLRDKGYATCLLGKNHLVEWNLHKKWFDATPSWDFDRRSGYADEPGERLRRASYAGTVPDDYDMSRHEDVVTARETCEFLRRFGDRPFLALADIGKPHPKYELYPTYPAAKIDLKEIPVPPAPPLDRAPSVERCIRTSKRLEDLGDDDRRRVVRAYESMCEFADDQVRTILDELDRLHLAENTLVIYCADHGDFAGEHNCYEKWDTCFYECITNVPLLLRLPAALPRGKRLDPLVELVDVMPTILDLLELPTPRYVQGTSLLPLMAGRTEAHKEAVFSQGGVERDLVERPWRPAEPSVKQQVLLDFPEAMTRAHMVRTDRYKYVYRLAGDCELYDLEADPDELFNLADDVDHQPIVADLKDRLLRFFVRTETNLPEVDELIA